MDGSADTQPDQAKEEDPTLVEIYEEWEQSLSQALIEVNALRDYLHDLAQSSERECHVHVHVGMPQVYTGVATNTYDPTTTSNQVYGHHTVSTHVPYLNVKPGTMKIEHMLRMIPQNTQDWYATLVKKRKELDIAKQTILKLGILKKAKAEQR